MTFGGAGGFYSGHPQEIAAKLKVGSYLLQPKKQNEREERRQCKVYFYIYGCSFEVTFPYKVKKKWTSGSYFQILRLAYLYLDTNIQVGGARGTKTIN